MPANIWTEAFGVDPNAKLNLTQKTVLTAMVIFLIVVIGGSVLGSKLGVLYTYYTSISVAGMKILFWIAMTVIKINGKPMLDLREASGMFGWDMLFLVAIALLILSVLTSAGTGISAWIGSVVGSLFTGKSPVVFLIVLAALTLFLANVANT